MNLQFRVTEEEYEILENNFGALSKSISRKNMKKEILENLPEDKISIKKTLLNLENIGNEINVIAKNVNIKKSANLNDIEMITSDCKKIIGILTNAKKSISK